MAAEAGFGEDALMWAAAQNHPEAARLLIDHGAQVDGRSNVLKYPKDRFGLEAVYTILPRGNWTPLMYAARQGSLGAARVLADALDHSSQCQKPVIHLLSNFAWYWNQPEVVS